MRSVNSFYESDSEPYKNSTVPSLQAQQQLLLMQYDIWASVYQFTQVNGSLHRFALLALASAAASSTATRSCIA